ncbi:MULTISPECIES: hypothetical protein [Cyanophyceae]|uniref:hypothetical protein n=1 Tax=Cyanophyceae TaxID=3028117 RepID=UPI000745948A|nr:MULTISPECIES: hypothetical protein [Cyanophyceae]AMA10852.1 hypothetical protein AWQ23_15595 [Picosynechococcus sp. PCC 73109]ANV92123.1 hypothetical protein AWQ24_15200 [Picosynechococcus sp. PCC 8807]
MATGLPQINNNTRLHFDIYAILEGSQELYLGHEVQVNVNMVEVVKLSTRDGQSLEKCYISPTKRRGVERRCLIWAPHKDGTLLGDKLKCGIPATCAEIECPICSVFGGLEAGKKTLIGRVSHGGGVAIQNIDPEEKQRAMHPSRMASPKSGKDETPIPFKRQYNQPGILYPVSNHGLSITDQDFAAVAYAFLDALPRIGSGNPKGVAIAENPDTHQPLLVVDRYLVPRGKRPVISPSVTDPEIAVNDFIRLSQIPEHESENHVELNHFERWIGDTALAKLQDYSSTFVDNVLQK